MLSMRLLEVHCTLPALVWLQTVIKCQRFPVVMTMEEDPEIIGYMRVSVEALKVLKTVKNRT